MGILSDILAIKDVSRIKAGGVANLSISQIANLITNLPDAKKKLTKEQYDAVYALYKEFRSCTTKMPMHLKGYTDTVFKMIKRYDAIAPYEKFGGGNETEFAFMMDDLRGVDESTDLLDVHEHKPTKTINTYSSYAEHLVNTSDGIISNEDALIFIDVIRTNELHGKEKALAAFDEFARNNIDGKDYVCFTKVHILAAALTTNNIVTEEESEMLSNKYNDLYIENMKR